ncbi:MAG TPA: hypothetical protein VLM85_05860 [Polyangiaceae bacterium]|nr:hypothetical protein [Polyangiaceae bacterium]
MLGVAAAIFVVTMAAAGGCGGQIVGADGGGGGCTVPGGTYLEHFVAESPSCPALQDTTYTFNGTTTLSAIDAGAPSNGCTVDVTGCTVSYACTQMSGSYTIQMNESLSYASDGTAAGKVTETVTGNNVSTTCTYDVTVSKK